MKKYAQGGIYTEAMGQPPMDIDGASAGMAKPTPKPIPMPTRPVRPSKMAPEGRAMKRDGRNAAKADMQKKATPKKYAQGGSVSKRADGIAQRGKTSCKVY
jgi:hypothetical protein